MYYKNTYSNSSRPCQQGYYGRACCWFGNASLYDTQLAAWVVLLGTFAKEFISRNRLSPAITSKYSPHWSQGWNPRWNEKSVGIYAWETHHRGCSLLIREFRRILLHWQRRSRYRSSCQRFPSICRFTDNEVVWTFMKFEICLCFWGVFDPWRGSVASYTTDEREKLPKRKVKTEFRRDKTQIESSSEMIRRLHSYLRFAQLVLHPWTYPQRAQHAINDNFHSYAVARTIKAH